MSNIYIQEPPTNGKVLLQTTVGDIDIELWSKEAPKACRNFVQLCLEGYYDGTVFHRLIKGFIVQGGDPDGDGTGGESIYGYPFKDEFHSRLRFVRRGLVAMANSGKDDNGSQFFFTLGASPELQNKNTIFGKVTGNTLYNMLKLEDGLVDSDDRPLYPHKIILTKVLSNPFPDIEPRIKSEIKETISEKPKEKGKKDFKLLSFGDEAEEDEAEILAVNETFKGQSKSSHDLTNDPKLSSVPAVDIRNEHESGKDKVVVDNIRKKLEKAGAEKHEKANAEKLNSKEEPASKVENETTDEMDESLDKRKEIQRQIKELKKELSRKKKEKIDISEKVDEKEPEKEENEVLAEYHKQLEKYKSKPVSRKGTSEREAQTLKFLEKFKNSMEAAKKTYTDETKVKSSDEEDDDNEAWLAHCLRADDQKVVLAKDANIPAQDRYDISDPRNPINERRRKEKKMRK
ncbi:spliceosome-associated protein CWC27 homolog [Trichonephila clavata]|uniref:Spliceosome-associated protein CWC27 homolog n=1 Tax=Trichonephila clavata TaxID=2740835 RepID=A0A8X6K4Z7_TRICU|nr:spliceosome-associated protein CWC27 homolog [Trichonephila clavata]